jgi:hypothetical protein
MLKAKGGMLLGISPASGFWIFFALVFVLGLFGL